jgi:hypothetical protein
LGGIYNQPSTAHVLQSMRIKLSFFLSFLLFSSSTFAKEDSSKTDSTLTDAGTAAGIASTLIMVVPGVGLGEIAVVGAAGMLNQLLN